MKGVINYIFNASPKKLAILVVLLPLLLVVLHTILSVIYRNLDASNTELNSTISILITLVVSLFLIPFLIWFLWIKGVILSVEKKDLGVPFKWFTIASVILFVYITFNIAFYLVKSLSEERRYIFYALSEFINFAGLIVAYPLICHYAARAIYIKKNNKVASFFKSIGYTILLIFMPISIPFFHNYFSSATSENQQIVNVYLVALSILVLLAISAFVLAILGLI